MGLAQEKFIQEFCEAWGDGSLEAIEKTIRNGVPEPKEHPGAMPPMGGVTLPDSHVKAVAAYVWAIGHQKKQ